MENQYCYKYPRPALTTDQVIFGFGEGELRVLLIRRGNEPFKGKWALPGGFMDMDEDAETCARRELEEETGLKVVNFEQLYAFSDVDRDTAPGIRSSTNSANGCRPIKVKSPVSADRDRSVAP